MLKGGIFNPNINEPQDILSFSEATLRSPLSLLFTIIHGNILQEVSNNITGKLFKGLKGVENVYTQHSPLLKKVLDDCIKNRLKPNLFPALGQTSGKVNTIVAFIIGGITYEEAFAVHTLNSTLGVQIILGGTSILNSHSFLEQIKHSYPESG